MSHYQTEEQQLENIKEFFKKYQNWIMLGFILLLLSILGQQYWYKYQITQAKQASMAFESLMQAIMKNDSKKSQAYSSQLIDEYPSSVYGQTAILYKAKLEVEQGHLDIAKTYLNQVAKHSRFKDMRDLAYLRLARIELDQKLYKNTRVSLSKISDDSAYLPLVFELQGDLSWAEARPEIAKQWYEKSISALNVKGIKNKILEMKQLQVMQKNN